MFTKKESTKFPLNLFGNLKSSILWSLQIGFNQSLNITIILKHIFENWDVVANSTQHSWKVQLFISQNVQTHMYEFRISKPSTESGSPCTKYLQFFRLYKIHRICKRFENSFSHRLESCHTGLNVIVTKLMQVCISLKSVQQPIPPVTCYQI